MLTKIKINIFSAIFCLAASSLFSVPLWAAADSTADFSGNQRLKEAIWQLGAFVSAAESPAMSSRSLVIDGVRGLPPTTITLFFDEPLDPWPVEINLSFQAESGNRPLVFTMNDRRPFGGSNIKLSGVSPREYGQENPISLFLDILERLNDRLLSGRPLIEPIIWSQQEPGLEAARTRLLYGARLGSRDLYLVRMDPEKFVFRPYHETNFPTNDLAAMIDWAELLPQASAIINGGQYYPDRTYMGRLNRDEVVLSNGPHPSWQGFLVSAPTADAPAGAPKAAVIDLDTHRDEWRPEHYKNVMQSFMLLDRLRRIRVRNSYNLASRSAIGQDNEGRIIFIMTPAAATLYDLATVLKSSGLDLLQVMGLDGGFESQLLLRSDNTAFIAAGHFSITDKKALFLPGYSPSLPAVLAAEPIEKPSLVGPVMLDTVTSSADTN